MRLCEDGRAPSALPGFGTSRLQSEMILPHISAQLPGSKSLRQTLTHLRCSQVGSPPCAEAALITTAAKTRIENLRMQKLLSCSGGTGNVRENELAHAAMRSLLRHPHA